MDIKQIQIAYQAVLQLLLSGRLKQAFDKIGALNSQHQNWTLRERFDNLQQNYRYMLQYYVAGVEDPERITVYKKLISELFLLNEEVREQMFVQNSANFEYSQKRYFPHARKFRDSYKLLDAFREIHSQTAVLVQENEELHKEEITRLRSEYEKLLPETFRVFWLKTQFLQDDKTLFQQITDENYGGLAEKSLIVSALTLNLWRMFDEEKLLMLFDCCEAKNEQVKQRALVGLCFILAKYDRYLIYFPMVRNRLVLLADDEQTVQNFRNIMKQIIGTTETEKISRKLRDEIMPEIIKLTPKLKNKLEADNFIASDDDDWDEENPQWQEIIEESGVSDKLQELSELQMEGADVYMGTFAMLKNFPFFAEFSNWFLPFDPNHTAISILFDNSDKNILSAFVGSQVMCNSDLYSFCLSVSQMPEKERGMLKKTFKMESEQMEEIKKDEALLTPDTVSKNISKQYVQDLFRFFKLFPQRGDFSDVFHSSLHIHKTYLFNILSADFGFKSDIADYYFSKNLYAQSLELFDQLLGEDTPTAAMYQKIGYAYQKTSQLEKALETYLKADMIQPDDLWTVKKIALCYRLAGEYEKSLEFYQRADFLNLGKFSTQMQIANAYLQAGKYKDALKIYYKLDAENEDNTKIQRAIAWTSFVSGNLKEAEYYAQKILADKPTAHDFLNAGHIAWCEKDRKTALEHYRKSLELQKNNSELFLEALNEDVVHLKANGVDLDEVSLMVDAVLS